MGSAAVSLGGGDGVDVAPGGGITASGGDISSDLGSTLSSAFDSAFADTPADTPAPDATPDPQPDAAPEPIAEPADATPEPVTEPEAAAPVATTPADATQYQLTPDGKAYQIPKAEFAHIQQAQKYHAQVGQLFPTPQDAHTSYQQASDLRTMLNDYITGSEPNIQAVMNYWAGGDHAPGSPIQQQFQNSFIKMAQHMPDMLAKLNPQAHEAMLNGMVTKAIDLAYDKAAASGNPDDLKRAQELDWGVTGQYKTELPKVDPALKAQQEFEQRQTQFNQQRDRMLDSQIKHYNQSQVEGAKFGAVNELIDKTLAKVKDRYTDIAYNDLRNGIQQELGKAMRGEQTATYPNGIPGQREWFAEHKQAFDQLMNDFRTSWDPSNPGRGLEARAQAFRQSYVNRANQYLPSIAAPRITAATRTPGAARTAQPARAPQRAAQQPATGAPAPDPNKRLSNDEWQAELNRTLTVA